MSPATVHVVVVNWNTAVSALSAAAHYRASTGVTTRVTIADNASEPEQQALLSAEIGNDIELRLEAENRGYGAAANGALAGSDAELVCVSNADLEPEPEMLAQLARVALGDPHVGIVAPRLTGGGRRYHALLPRAWTLPLRAFAGSFGYRTVADPAPGQIAAVQQPAGACVMLRRAVWDELGGFDPGFFLWFEDVDLARRSRAAGYVNLVVGAAAAHHVGGEAFTRLDERSRQQIRMRSLERYVAIHHPRLGAVTRAAVAVAGPGRRLERRVSCVLAAVWERIARRQAA